MTFNDYKIWQSLIDERQRQVQRDGVIVRFQPATSDQRSYLEYQNMGQTGLRKFQHLFYPIKYPLQLFDQQIGEILTFERDEYDVQPPYFTRIYLKEECLLLETGHKYVLVKNNATLGMHSMVLLNRLGGQTYFQKLENFMNNPDCREIQMDEFLKIPFEYQKDLNPEQNLAIQSSFRNHLTFVRGPPGCGKTVTIARMVTMMAGKGRKVLIGSTSNVANYALVIKIIEQIDKWNEEALTNSSKHKIRMIIHLSQEGLQRFDKDIQKFLINQQLCELIMEDEKYSCYEVNQIMKMIKQVQKMKIPSHQFLELYNKCHKRLMDETTIALTTTTNSFKLRSYTNYKPEIGILDEAAQASISDCYGFLSFGINRIICVGDEKQLAPTVIGNAIKNDILKMTIFELSKKNPDYTIQLQEQFRMHPRISQFANRYVYDGILKDAKITHTERQSDLKYFQKYPASFIEHDFEEQVQLINHSELKIDRQQGTISSVKAEKGKPEYYNQLEGSLIMDFLIHVIPPEQWKHVTILTFYKRQMFQIEYGLRCFVESFGDNYEKYGLTVKTVDGYQGGQKDYIIVSTVRSNPFIRNSDFFANLNRVNVALTRAKKGLIVFGNSQTLKLTNLPSKEVNIWGKFYQFNEQKKSVVNFNDLKAIIEDQIEFKSVKNTVYLLNIELLWAIHNLTHLEFNLNIKPKLEQEIDDKNQQTNREAKRLIKLLRKLPVDNVSRQQRRAIISNFLNSKNNQNPRPCLLGQRLLGRDIIEEFAIDHFTLKENSEIIKLLRSISSEITQKFEQPAQKNQKIDDNITFGNAIVNIVNQKIQESTQRINQTVHQTLFELMQLTEEEYNRKSIAWKIDTKNSLVSQKVMLKFIRLLNDLIRPYCEFIKDSLNPEKISIQDITEKQSLSLTI